VYEGQNGPKSTVLVARKATVQVRPRVFGQFQKGFSANFALTEFWEVRPCSRASEPLRMLFFESQLHRLPFALPCVADAQVLHYGYKGIQQPIAIALRKF
jgi:hypothetical protein